MATTQPPASCRPRSEDAPPRRTRRPAGDPRRAAPSPRPHRSAAAATPPGAGRARPGAIRSSARDRSSQAPAPPADRTLDVRPRLGPDLPAGALRGDPARQPFSFKAPVRFYVDVERRCRGCGVAFVLFAREQKRWAETLGLKLDSRSECPACRRAYLGDRASRALADSSRALAASPFHVPAVLAYARAAAAHAFRFGHAPLDRPSPPSPPSGGTTRRPSRALYLEGRCHEAGEEGRAASVVPALPRPWKVPRGSLARQAATPRMRLAAAPGS